MNSVSDEFFKLFEVAKVEYREHGRDVDDEGNLCSWYVDYDYPCIEPVFFDLLNIYEVQYSGREFNCPLKSYNLKMCLMQCLIDLYNVIDDDLKQSLKEDVKYTFEEYYGGVKHEC